MRIHGMYKAKEHYIWRSMLQRCSNKSRRDYARYGGRGIRVCPRWMSFKNFFADMGPRPSPKHSLERKNNALGYSPSNCCWATASQQAANTIRNINVTINGVTMCVGWWAKIVRLKPATIRARIKRYGWDPVDAVLKPSRYEK